MAAALVVGAGAAAIALWAVQQESDAPVGRVGVPVVETRPASEGSLTPSAAAADLPRPPKTIPPADPLEARPGTRAERFIYAQSAEDLIEYVSSVTNYTRKDLESFGHLHDFAKRLYQLAAVEEYGSRNNAVPLMGAIEFTDSPAWPMGESRNIEQFGAKDTSRIYALLPPIPTDSGELFVRWTRVDTPGLILFQKYTTASDVARNHVWAEHSDGWEPGNYRVEVYSSDEFLDLLAAGDYVAR